MSSKYLYGSDENPPQKATDVGEDPYKDYSHIAPSIKYLVLGDIKYPKSKDELVCARVTNSTAAAYPIDSIVYFHTDRMLWYSLEDKSFYCIKVEDVILFRMKQK